MSKLQNGNETFGSLLRYYRQRSFDRRARKSLSQTVFSQRLEKYGQYSSKSTVSAWESDKSQIRAEDRELLLAIINLLVNTKGIKHLEEANKLLHIGGYRSLSEEEISDINLEWKAEMPEYPEPPPHQYNLAKKFWQQLTEKQPTNKHISERFVDGFNWLTSDWTPAGIFRVTAWLLLVLFVWWLGVPLLQIPLTSWQMPALQYWLISLLLPLLMAGLIWEEGGAWIRGNASKQRGIRWLNIWLGSGMGFQIGYATLLFSNIILFDLIGVGWGGFPRYLQLVGAGWIIFLGYLAGHLVPQNRWLAYRKWVWGKEDWLMWIGFFLLLPSLTVFLIVEFQQLLILPFVGTALLLVSVILLAGLIYQQTKRTGKGILPASFWVAVGIVMGVLFSLQKGDYIFASAFLFIGIGLWIIVKWWEGSK